jgi:hypothetical protein
MINKKLFILVVLLISICTRALLVDAWFTIRYGVVAKAPTIEESYIVDLLYFNENVEILSQNRLNSLVPYEFLEFYASHWNGIGDSDQYVSARLYPNDNYSFTFDSSLSITTITLKNDAPLNFKILFLTASGIGHVTDVIIPERRVMNIEFTTEGYHFTESDGHQLVMDFPPYTEPTPFPNIVIVLIYITILLAIRTGLFFVFGFYLDRLSIRSILLFAIYSIVVALLMMYVDFRSNLASFLFVLLLGIIVFADFLLSFKWLIQGSYVRSTLFTFLSNAFLIFSLMFLIQNK